MEKEYLILSRNISGNDKAAAIYLFIQEKIKLAENSGRMKTASKIRALLPAEIRERVQMLEQQT